MDDGLWDIAARQWRKAIIAPNTSEKQLTEAQLLLAESLVRGHEGEEAMNLLSQEKFRESSLARFWLGQAMAGMGQFSQATELLAAVAKDPGCPFRSEAAFTASHLHLALAQYDAALQCLTLIQESTNKEIRAESRLRQISILLELKKIEEARAILPTSAELPQSLIDFAKLLEAQLLLAENKVEAAQPLFQALLISPQGQSSERYQAAVLGYADCLAQLGNQPAAAKSLLDYLEEHPDNTALDAIFERVISWLPKSISSLEDPSLASLAQWLPDSSPSSSGLINTIGASAVSAWPSVPNPLTELEIYTLNAYAIGLYRIETAATKQAAFQHLQRLTLLAPLHPLALKSLMTLASWKLQEGDPNTAFQILDVLRNDSSSLAIRGEAAFTNAYNAFQAGDHSLAANLFDEAAILLDGKNQNIAAFNSAISRLRIDPAAPSLTHSLSSSALGELAADLELERALAAPSPQALISGIEQFLKHHSAHPLVPKARLSLAEAALSSSPPDSALARAQLDTIQASIHLFPKELIPRLSTARLRLVDRDGNTSETIAMAKQLLAEFPNTPIASDAAMILGKNLFRAENYNEARLVWEKQASSEPNSQQAQVALLMAARAAALGATAQSREEALAIYRKVSATDSSIQFIAILEQAQLLIDLDRLPLAIELLRPIFTKLPTNHPSQLPTGLLLAEAIYANATSKPESLAQAVAIYDDLLKQTSSKDPMFAKLQYLRGLSLERLPDPKDPSHTLLTEAHEAYYSVMDRPVSDPPAEWEWFERSSFRLLSLLETKKNWKAAISIAEKIASFKGPRSSEAAEHAQQLRLKHMVWDD